MASKNITRKISIFINGKQVENNLGSVGRAVGTLRRELKKLTPGTQAFIDKSKKLKDVKHQYALIKREIEGVPPLFKRMTKGVGGFLGAFGIGLGITGVIRGIQNLTTANAELGEAQADVQKTTGLTKTQVDELTKSLKKIDTRTGITELLGLAESAGRLNIKGKKDIEAFVRATDKAFVALGDSLEGTAADIGLTLGKLAGNFDLDKKYGISDAMNKIGSSLNELGANSKASEGPIVDFTRRLAGVSAQAEISLPNIAALGALFDENGQSVEVSATTFNKLLPAIGKDVKRFAKIAGLNVKDFKKVVETDAFEALKLVAKGAKSNQRGLLGLTETLKDYGIDSARAASIVGILSNKTDRLTELQKISNNAFNKGTSLTQEFNVKNTTLGAILDKIGNTISQKFTGSGTQNFLKGIAAGFLSVLTPAKDLSKEFFDSKISVASLESSINPLLSRYDDLKEKTLLTKDEQIELNGIILKVAEDIPTAITQFNKYGKAMDISTTAAKAFITQQQNLLEVKNKKAIKQATEQLNLQNEALKTLNHTYQLGKDGVLRYFEAPRGIAPAGQDFLTKATSAQVVAFQTQQEAINKSIDGYKTLIKELKGKKTEEERAAEAARLKAAAEAKRLEDARIAALKATAEKEALTKKQEAAQKSLTNFLNTQIKQREINLKLGLDKELALIDEKFRKQIEKAKENGLKTDALEAERDKQKEDATKLYNLKLGTIQEKKATKSLKKLKDQFDREKLLRKTTFNNQLFALGNNEIAKAKLKKKYEETELEAQKTFLNKLVAENKIILANLNKDVNLSLLTPEQTQIFEDNIIKLKAQIAVLLNEIKKLKGGESSTDFNILQGAGTDILGFSPEQWTSVFENIDHLEDKLDRLEHKIKATEIVFGGLRNVWSLYSNFVDANQQKELKALDKKQKEERKKLKQQVDDKVITEETYNKRIEALDNEKNKLQAEAEYKRAKNDRIGALFSIATSTAIGIMKAVAAFPLNGGMPWTAIIGGLGALEAALVLSTPLPSKTFAQGGFTGNLGYTDNTGHEVAGIVHANEYVIPKFVLDQTEVAPIVQYLEAKRTGVPTFTDGGATTPNSPSFTAETTTNLEPQSNELLIATLEMLSRLNENLENGIVAVMSNDLQTAKQIKDAIKDYEKLRNKNKIT